MHYTQLDADPQQTVLKNLQPGIQLLLTINIENIIDQHLQCGLDKTATELGKEIIQLLIGENQHLSQALNPTQYIQDVVEEVDEELNEEA